MVRLTYAMLCIALIENVPQFIIVFSEIFVYNTTVTFIQAGFPIISLCMINKTLAMFLAQMIYQIRNNTGKVFTTILLIFLFAPQIAIMISMQAIFISESDVANDLYTHEMLVRSEPTSSLYYVLIFVATISATILLSYLQCKKKIKKDVEWFFIGATRKKSRKM
jgi:hypothetical protein